MQIKSMAANLDGGIDSPSHSAAPILTIGETIAASGIIALNGRRVSATYQQPALKIIRKPHSQNAGTLRITAREVIQSIDSDDGKSRMNRALISSWAPASDVTLSKNRSQATLLFVITFSRSLKCVGGHKHGRQQDLPL